MAKLKILFVHQNFPGQFKYLADYMSITCDVTAFHMGTFNGTSKINSVKYQATRASSKNIHPWVTDFETKVIRGDAALRAAIQMKKIGYYPDVIYAHPGWGESLFLKEIWPNSKLILYGEYYYNTNGFDVNFDPEIQSYSLETNVKLFTKNANNLLNLSIADKIITPTQWQRDSFPIEYQNKITVVHDGIDCNICKPNIDAFFENNGKIYTSNSNVVTYINRSLEPYRGIHIFLRALPIIQKKNKDIITIIVGEENIGYGPHPPLEWHSWKDFFMHELKDKINWNRVIFTGKISHQRYINLLQISLTHVYLTYPFVLSWSLLEAMACGCHIVASDTCPVTEFIEHGKNGRLINFFNHIHLADAILESVENHKNESHIAHDARQKIIDNLDLHSITLPKISRLLKNSE